MEFRILGPLEVEEDGRQVALGGEKQRALLALLLLSRGRPVSTDRLIEEVWSGRPPATAVKSVQVYVTRLRRALGEGRIITRSRGYELAVAPGELDVDCFDALVRATSGAPAKEAAERLREALALFRGRPLSDLSLEPWAQVEIAGLEERQLAALEARIDADLELGRHRELIAELEAVLTEHPFREHLLEQLVLALYRSGRRPTRSTHTGGGPAGCAASSGLSRDARCRSSKHGSSARIDTRPAAGRRPARRTCAELEARRHRSDRHRRARRRRRRRCSHTRKRHVPCFGRFRRRHRRRVERPPRRAHRGESDQGPGGGHHRRGQLLGLESAAVRNGADRSRQRSRRSSDRLSARRYRRLGDRRRPKPLARRPKARPHGYPPR